MDASSPIGVKVAAGVAWCGCRHGRLPSGAASTILYENTVITILMHFLPVTTASAGDGAGGAAPRRLLAPLRERIRDLHHGIRTEEACVHWVRAVVRFHGGRHPRAVRSPLDALLPAA